MSWATSGVTSYAESRIVVLGIVGCYPDRRSIVSPTSRRFVMGFIDVLFAKWKRNPVGRVIQALAEIEGHISAVENEKKSMEERNPLIGRVGIMMGIGSPPPGFESRIQAAESKYDELVRRLSNYSQKEGDLKARLSALTGKTFKKSSEWDEWFRKEYQAVPLTEDQKAAIEELLGDLGNERDIEGRINAAE